METVSEQLLENGDDNDKNKTINIHQIFRNSFRSPKAKKKECQRKRNQTQKQC